MSEHEAIEGVPADVDLGPVDLRREELPEVVLVVHTVPDERDAAPQLRSLHQTRQPVGGARDRPRRGLTRSRRRSCRRAGTGSLSVSSASAIAREVAGSLSTTATTAKPASRNRRSPSIFAGATSSSRPSGMNSSSGSKRPDACPESIQRSERELAHRLRTPGVERHMGPWLRVGTNGSRREHPG